LFTVRESELGKYMIVFSVYDYDRLGCNLRLGTTNIRVQYFREHAGETVNLALQLQNEFECADAVLLIKGQYVQFEELERVFWRSVVNDSTVTDSSSIDDAEVEEFKTSLIDSIKLSSSCPFCGKSDTNYQHIVICNYKSSLAGVNKQTRGDFITEEFASRKWFNRLLGMMGFGGYRLGGNTGHILVHDRRTGRTVEERIPLSIKLAIRWMHGNVLNRQAVDWSLTRSIFTILTMRQGAVYGSEESVKKIPGFIKYHKLNMEEVDLRVDQFKTFNEFFYRRLKPGARQLACPGDDRVMVSPADSRLHCYQTVDEATRIWIKGKRFSIRSLLSDHCYDRFMLTETECSMVILRLAPQDYHRFHSPVAGNITEIHDLAGAYFTVNPMAVRQNIDIFTENRRIVIMVESEEFGRCAVVAIGAMMVGSVVVGVKEGERVERMEEIGYFAFGGSTVVVLVGRGRIRFDQDLVNNSRIPIETLVQVGEQVGVCQW
jgi:phosphatidylserine decarboxylase